MPAVYPSLASAAGTKLSISTTAPATHTVAGFDGIAAGSWKDVGFITSPGGFPRGVREYEDVDLLDGSSLVIIQPERMESIEVEAVYQPEDAGQAAVQAASNGKTIVWFRWTTPAGRKVYCAGYVTGYAPNVEDVTGYVSATFTIKPIYDATGSGAVYGAATP